MRKGNPNDEMVTVSEAQRIFNMNKKDLYKMIKSGRLETQKIGSNVQINKKSLRALLKCSNKSFDNDSHIIVENVTPSEMKMIEDWT